MNTYNFKKQIVAGTVCIGLLLSSVTTFGANWLTLQGTEPAGAEKLAKVWGFVQVQYQDDQSDPNPAGGYIPPKLIAPDWKSQSAFNVNRARIGVRGVAMPLDQKINYFLLLEMGNNAITEPGGCLTCHDPHASTVKFGLKADPMTLCLTCHSQPVSISETSELPAFSEELEDKSFLHGPVAQRDCSGCHQKNEGAKTGHPHHRKF